MAKAKMFERLFEPGIIGTLEVKNRLVKAPQNTQMGARDGSVTPRQIRYYKELALGGVGLVIVEYAYIDHDASKSAACQISVADNEYIPSLAWLAQTIQENGAKAALQIEHCGRQKFLGTPPMKAPSRVPWEELTMILGAPIPEELTIEEIHGIVEAFGDAARRTKMAGFDMVEIHGAHGYLITEFLSPRTNKRTDWYGGSLENRMRFLLEVIHNARSKVGPDYPVGVRLSGSEYEPDGIMIEETIEVAKVLEKAGVNVIHASGGNHHTVVHQVTPMYLSLAHNVWAAEAIKKQVGIPVIASGSITSPELAAEILESGKADFIALGRPLWADPFFPNKAREGRPEDIAPCIRCNDGCIERGAGFLYRSVQCTVNVALGKEDEFKITPTEKPKRVAVIGGGPAGMEAARVAALRGHDVTLYEKRKLGGRLNEASVPDFKADLRPLKKYLSTQVEKLKIRVVNEEATPENIKKEKYDAVILAAGGVPIVPDIPGKDSPMVVSAMDVLNGSKKVGTNVAVIGGGLVGAETAWWLAQNGKKVTAVEMLDEFAADVEPMSMRPILVGELERLEVKVYTGKRLEEVTAGEIIIVDRYGNRARFNVDNVVMAAGFAPNNQLVEEFKEICDEVYVVGDCKKPGLIFDAIHEAHVAARCI